MAKTAGNALIQYESNAVGVTEEMTSTDDTTFVSTASVWSKKSGLEPVIMPDGIVTGYNLLSPGTANDDVDVSAFTAYIGGALRSVSADTVAITRASTDTHIVNSIICDNAGALTAIQGTEGTSFSTTRGAAGGPPLITVGQIEVGQVKTSAQAAAVIVASEIAQNPSNGEQERYDVPVFEVNALGDGNTADSAAKTNAYVEFSSALPSIHVGSIAKDVYCTVYEPDFTDIEESSDFVPAEEVPSVSSKQIYRKTTASASFTLGAGTFKIYFENPIGHPLKKLNKENLVFKFFPDENSAEYSLTQGVVGFSSTYPVDDDMAADVTIGATQATVGFDS